MTYTSRYESPLGSITMAADEIGLTGLWFDDQIHFGSTLPPQTVRQEIPVLFQTKQWLDAYFSGSALPDTPAVHLIGSPFRQTVWAQLSQISLGQTITYGELARLASTKPMSAQAVGGAVGHNPISILIPCHRVVGSNGQLTGYAGGLDRKQWLLAWEQTILSKEKTAFDGGK